MIYLCLVVRLGRCGAVPAPSMNLEGFGFKTFHVAGLDAAREMLSLMRFDAVLVEGEAAAGQAARALPVLAGFQAPVIVFGQLASEDEEVALLEAGAAEVVSQGTSSRLGALKVLKAVQAARGAQGGAPATLVVGPLTLDPLALTASLNQRPLPLTPKQFDLLFAMASRAGKLVHRGALDRVLNPTSADTGRSLDMQICRIRKCLRDAGDASVTIRSVYAFGYCLTTGGDEPAADVEPARELDLSEA